MDPAVTEQVAEKCSEIGCDLFREASSKLWSKIVWQWSEPRIDLTVNVAWETRDDGDFVSDFEFV